MFLSHGAVLEALAGLLVGMFVILSMKHKQGPTCVVLVVLISFAFRVAARGDAPMADVLDALLADIDALIKWVADRQIFMLGTAVGASIVTMFGREPKKPVS